MNKTGFGFLRIPKNEDETIDYEALNPMVDLFLEQGGTYFDTAYTYLNGLSEEALRLSLVGSVDKVIIGNIMSLIPGIGLTNALRDLFTGDHIAGLLRTIESVMIALVIAAGYVLSAILMGGV